MYDMWSLFKDLKSQHLRTLNNFKLSWKKWAPLKGQLNVREKESLRANSCCFFLSILRSQAGSDPEFHSSAPTLYFAKIFEKLRGIEKKFRPWGREGRPRLAIWQYQLCNNAFQLAWFLFSAVINFISLTVETTKRSFKRRRRDTSGPTYSSLPTFPRPPSYYFLSGNRPRHESTTSAPASTGE